jgi:hypothetical protein
MLRIHDILVWIRIQIWISGSMPLTNEFGSTSGSGSCYFLIDLQETNKNIFIFSNLFFLLHFKGTFTSFLKKVKKKSQINRNQSYCCLMIEGTGSRSHTIPLTNGSGSGSRRPKNIRIQMRISNTAF